MLLLYTTTHFPSKDTVRRVAHWTPVVPWFPRTRGSSVETVNGSVSVTGNDGLGRSETGLPHRAFVSGWSSSPEGGLDFRVGRSAPWRRRGSVDEERKER